MPPVSILLIGANGYFGSLLLEELLTYTQSEIIAAGRHWRRLDAVSRNWPAHWLARIERRQVDLCEPQSILASLAGAKIAVCAAGPYQQLPHHLLKICLEQNLHYVDISDDRAFVREARRLGAEEGERPNDSAAICSGWSSMP